MYTRLSIVEYRSVVSQNEITFKILFCTSNLSSGVQRIEN